MMIGNMQDKVAIVTGAGQGIGEGIAKVFSNAGANIIVATRSKHNGQETVDDIISAGGDAMVAQTVAQYGQLDIAIHNAAVFPMLSIENLTIDDLETTLSVNLKAAFWLTQAALPHLHKSASPRLIFTFSVTGPRVAMPLTSHYAASKSGLNGFIRTATLEFARAGITVNGVEPGYTLTQAMALLADEEELKEMVIQIPKGTLGKPEDIANTMLFLASEEASYITGQTIVVDGGSTLPESPIVLNNFYASL